MTPPGVSHLRDTLKVEPLDDGRVSVTVVLPPDLAADYCRFLEALADFFRSAKRKGSISLIESRNRSLEPERQANLEAYRARLVAAFDRYTAEGLPRKKAVQRIAADLRAEDHPWSSPDLVRSQLVAAGRSGKAGRPRGLR